MTKKIALADASEAQLRAFAETHLGITLPGNAKIETLRAKVSQAWGKDEIVVDDTPTEEERTERSAPPRPRPSAQTPGSVRLIIQRSGDDATIDERVQLSVNGQMMLVPRGEPVWLSAPYFEVLEHAVKFVYDPVKDGGISVPRQVPRYAYQVLERVPRAAKAA